MSVDDSQPVGFIQEEEEHDSYNLWERKLEINIIKMYKAITYDVFYLIFVPK